MAIVTQSTSLDTANLGIQLVEAIVMAVKDPKAFKQSVDALAAANAQSQENADKAREAAKTIEEAKAATKKLEALGLEISEKEAKAEKTQLAVIAKAEKAMEDAKQAWEAVEQEKVDHDAFVAVTTAQLDTKAAALAQQQKTLDEAVNAFAAEKAAVEKTAAKQDAREASLDKRDEAITERENKLRNALA